MKIFKDTKDRQWEITLTVGSAMDVKARLDIDLLQPEQGDPPLITRIGTDEILLAEIILCLITDQIEARDLNAHDIKKAFDGATLLAAQRAFYEELVDFFHSRGREDRSRAVAKQKVMIEQAVAIMAEKIGKIDETKIMTDASGAVSGSSQALSASIPGS